MELQIGDRIYEKCYDKITNIFIVEKITKKFAICDKSGVFIKKYVQKDNILRNSRYKSSYLSYELESPLLVEKFIRQELIDKISKYKLNDLSTEELTKINKILK